MASGGIARRLGLDRAEARAWAIYDWANSAFMTSVVAAVFPLYFGGVAAAHLPPDRATRLFALATAVMLAVVALTAPVLGAIADRSARRKRFLGAFLSLGVGATASLYFIGEGDWLLAVTLFALANIGASGSFVFYDSLLPHIAGREEVDRVSAAGYSLGYLGGGVLLLLNLMWLRHPAAFGIPDVETASRLVFVTAAVWWGIFSIPLFRGVREPAREQAPSGAEARAPLGDALRRLARTFREIRRYRHAFLFLVAFLIYSDGIGTIIRLAVVYGSEIGIRSDALVAAILLVQFVAAPCTLLFGALAARSGAKAAIFLGLAVYGVISVLGYLMRSELHFFVLAFLVGTVQGGTQALSRSLFATLIPRARSAEFFAFFAVVERFAGLVGPTLFFLVGAATGSNRYAILALVGMFAIGAALLARVDVAEGQRRAGSCSRGSHP